MTACQPVLLIPPNVSTVIYGKEWSIHISLMQRGHKRVDFLQAKQPDKRTLFEFSWIPE
jgi:hypothetical protein